MKNFVKSCSTDLWFKKIYMFYKSVKMWSIYRMINKIILTKMEITNLIIDIIHVAFSHIWSCLDQYII